MDENEFESVVADAIKSFAKDNDLPFKVESVREKGFGEEAGLIVTVGGNEFHVSIHQTVFE